MANLSHFSDFGVMPFEQDFECNEYGNGNKLIIFDRDGTLNEDLGYTHKTSQLRLINHVMDLLSEIKRLALPVLGCVITNQSGVSRKLFDLEDLVQFNTAIQKEIADLTTFKLAKFYSCTHLPEDNCPCRKPKIYLYEKALKDFKIHKTNCIAIGNNNSDEEAAKNVGIYYISVNDTLLLEKVLNHLK